MPFKLLMLIAIHAERCNLFVAAESYVIVGTHVTQPKVIDIKLIATKYISTFSEILTIHNCCGSVERVPQRMAFSFLLLAIWI